MTTFRAVFRGGTFGNTTYGGAAWSGFKSREDAEDVLQTCFEQVCGIEDRVEDYRESFYVVEVEVEEE